MTLNIKEFNDIIEPLEELKTPLGDERNIYFSKLRPFSEFELKKCVDYLLETHRFKSFPQLALFFKIRKQIQDKQSQPKPEDLDRMYGEKCEKCHGGMKAKYYVAKYLNRECYGMTYCDCAEGQRLKRAHANYFNKRRRGDVGTEDINVKTDTFDDGEVPF